MKHISVIYEDNHLLVVEKPPLLATMGVAEGEVSLFTECQDYIGRKYNKPGKVYLGVVSRLDSHVSGLVVFARTSKAAARLNDQFRERSVEKVYWAIVAGPVELPAEGELVHWLWKDEARQRMVAESHPTRLNSQESRLSYTVLDRRGGRQLLRIKLETGRKHQIRAQLAAAGFPILGDRKYGSDHSFPLGIALHSQSLSLTHPTRKERLHFESEPPISWHLAGNRLAL